MGKMMSGSSSGQCGTDHTDTSGRRLLLSLEHVLGIAVTAQIDLTLERSWTEIAYERLVTGVLPGVSDQIR